MKKIDITWVKEAIQHGMDYYDSDIIETLLKERQELIEFVKEIEMQAFTGVNIDWFNKANNLLKQCEE